MHTTFAIVVFGFGLFCAFRKRLPWPMIAFVIVIGVMMLGPKIVSARPRFVFTAFPLAIAVAAWWPRKSRYSWDLLLLGSAGALGAFAVLYGGWAIIP
jgi:hydrogenase/urease accessory protein HupE